MITPPSWRPTNAEYHLSPGWSSTSLKAFRESPALAYRRYVLREEEAEAPTLAMLEGSAVHLLLTEPERADVELVLAQCEVRRGKAWESAVAQNPGCIVLPGPSWQAAHAMAAAILEPKTEMAGLAHALLCGPGGVGEYAHRWEEEWCGAILALRLKVDRLRELGAGYAIVELKSTRDPEPEAFGRQFEDMEYHVQAAHNRRGLLRVPEIEAACAAGVMLPVLAVAVRNEEPHEVAVYQVPETTLAEGLRVTEQTLALLGDCVAGAHPWCHPWECVTGREIPLLPRAPWRLSNR